MRLITILLCSICILQATLAGDVQYNEQDAIIYAIASGLAYCPPDEVMAENCHLATKLSQEHGMVPIHAFDNGRDVNIINYAILHREEANEIVITFSGTQGTQQLITEAVESYSAKYFLHEELKGAKVIEYFFWHYMNDFRSDFEEAFKKYVKDHPKSRVVFTGHSLGGAMTVHAAIDTILSGWIDPKQVVVYTYGQPRVGNSAFTNVLKNQAGGAFRVVHHRDIVAHIPPCHSYLTLNGCYESGIFAFYAYHHPTEVWYKEDFASHTICSGSDGEDTKCSNSVFETSIDDHLVYFGYRLGSLHTLTTPLDLPENTVSLIIK